jgi:ribonucleoside-triphosphate reductase (formate)
VKILTEVYSRVSGYFRPVNQWNKGKREEFSERKFADANKEGSDVRRINSKNDR